MCYRSRRSNHIFYELDVQSTDTTWPHAFSMQIKIWSWVEEYRILHCHLAAGTPGDAITGVQQGGGGEAEEDDGRKPSHPQVCCFQPSWDSFPTEKDTLAITPDHHRHMFKKNCRSGLFDWPSCPPVRRSCAGIKPSTLVHFSDIFSDQSYQIQTPTLADIFTR